MNILATTPSTLQIVSVLLLGLALGSFINVCIYRLPKNESIIAPGSYCESCKAKIFIWDNIPILSYLLLKGKCRQCDKSISILYPIVELSTSLLLLSGFIKFGISIKFAIFCAIGPALIAVAIIDFKHLIIPDAITLPGILFGFVAGSYLIGLKNSSLGLISGAGTFIVLSTIHYWIRGLVGMGGGDIKLIAAVGALLGIKYVFLVIFLSAFIGSLVGIIGVALRKLNFLSRVPFGSYLALGTLIVYFSGEDIINIYIKTIMSVY